MITVQDYWNSKDPRVVALGDVEFDAREDVAKALDAQGLVIDRAIDIYRWDPVKVMEFRLQLGVPFVPNAFQENLVDPFKTGVVPAGAIATDFSKQFFRSIKSSVDLADYPPFTVVTPAPDTTFDPVGNEIGNGTFAAISAANYANGDTHTKDGVTYVFHKVPGPFGPSQNWTVKGTN